VPDVLAHVAADRLLRHDIFDRPPLAAWGRGRITLLGDAAHPMTPDLGQGGCTAIEDALVLADRIAESRDLPAALRAYEGQRVPRTTRIARKARLLGRVGQEPSRVLGAVRNTLMRWRPAASYRREMRTYLDYDTANP
jgi:2-polyprenyl-6-methoxyphenol hydroxylase-like FAD-dependent oxidoreductase